MLRVRSLGEVNSDAVDPWSIVHFLTGVAAGQVVSFPVYLGLATAYEVAEYAHEYPKGSAIFGSKRPESMTNIVMDMILGTLGYMIAQKRR